MVLVALLIGCFVLGFLAGVAAFFCYLIASVSIGLDPEGDPRAKEKSLDTEGKDCK
jgi:hypothetical protein